MEKRVQSKNFWTQGAEVFIVFAGFGHGIQKNRKVGSLGQEAKSLA